MKTPPPSDDECDHYKIIQQEVDEKLKKLEEDREKERKAKEAKLRKWDIGKMNSSGAILTQEQWIERKRKDRLTEFAPLNDNPQNNSFQKSIHIDDSGVRGPNEAPSNLNSREELSSHPSDVQKECKNPQFAPPSIYEYYRPSHSNVRSKGRNSSSKDLERAISAGLANLRNAS